MILWITTCDSCSSLDETWSMPYASGEPELCALPGSSAEK